MVCKHGSGWTSTCECIYRAWAGQGLAWVHALMWTLLKHNNNNTCHSSEFVLMWPSLFLPCRSSGLRVFVRVCVYVSVFSSLMGYHSSSLWQLSAKRNSEVTPSARKRYPKSCIFRNLPWREKLAMRTKIFQKPLDRLLFNFFGVLNAHRNLQCSSNQMPILNYIRWRVYVKYQEDKREDHVTNLCSGFEEPLMFWTVINKDWEDWVSFPFFFLSF